MQYKTKTHTKYTQINERSQSVHWVLVIGVSVLSVPPGRARSQFLRKFLLGGGGRGWNVGVVNLAVLTCVWTTTKKERSSTF